jgi:hypothetical protein
MLHERLTDPLKSMFGTSGIFFFAWIIPYGLAFIIFAVIYLRFLIKLPKKIMLLFILSGAIYISGAIGIEMIGGVQANLHGYHNALFSSLYTFEESLEMIGSMIFIYTLLSYMETESRHATLASK